MSWTVALMSIAGGLVLLFAGAEGLVRGSARLALRLGLAPLVVGLTVVAFGTSSPELVVSVEAALAGRGAIAIGNVVGSNIANLALILGVSALIRPVRIQARLLRLDVPVVLACSVLLALLLADGLLGRLDGALLTAGIAAYLVFTLRQARRQRGGVRPEPAGTLPLPGGRSWLDVVLIVAGLGLLALGAQLLVEGAVAVAQRLRVTEAVIGLTIIAVGTSLPELATSVVAALRKEGDLAVGNVVGSNVFNILGILGLSSMVHALHRGGIDAVDLGVMIATALLMLPLMRTGFWLTRWEGALLVAGYGGYVWYLLA